MKCVFGSETALKVTFYLRTDLVEDIQSPGLYVAGVGIDNVKDGGATGIDGVYRAGKDCCCKSDCA